MRGYWLTVVIAITTAPVFFALPSAGFAASGINPFPSGVENLTPGESDAIKEAIGQALEAYGHGTVVTWKAADSKRIGQVRLLNIFDRDGRPCALVQNEFTKGIGNTYSLPFCKATD